MGGRAVALALLALLCAAQAKDSVPEWKRVKVNVGVAGEEYTSFPYWYADPPGSGNWTGYLRPVLDAVCEAAALDCTLVYFERATDRIPMILSGEADFLIDAFSATQERLKEVDFVQPGFFSAGVALYATPETGSMLEAAGGWDGAAGLRICVVDGYYATPGLVKQYGIVPVRLARAEDAVLEALGGNCTAFAYDSGFVAAGDAVGLPQAAGVAPVLTAPYAIPLKKGRESLKMRLSAAVVTLMQDGNASPLLEWEKEYLAGFGVPSNEQLFKVVTAVSYFE